MPTEQQVIAIIDDEPGVLRGLKRLLEVNGFIAETFPSGEAFLECDDANKTCIVLDIHLDGMSGIDVRRRLTDSGSTVPVIFMTGADSPAVRKEALEAGCAGYLRKPFLASELIDAIWNATSRRPLRDPARI